MDRITRVRIKNVRAIEDVELVLGKPLTVLIGENGSGKSTILECLELLRRASEPNFMSQFYEVHRGMPALLRKGATSLTLGVTVEDDAGVLPRLDYDITFTGQGAGASLAAERFVIAPDGRRGVPEITLERFDREFIMKPVQMTPDEATTYELHGSYKDGFYPIGTADLFNLVLTRPPPRAPVASIDRLVRALGGIETHLGFDTRASWAARAYQRPESMRVGMTHRPATRLSLLGVNLANAWSELRNRPSAHWEYSIALVRLGLGERVDNVLTIPDAGGGNIYLALRFEGINDPIFATDLSDGQLSWLAFVAMTRLNPGRSLLVVDEPELHMHPALLGRVMALLSSLENGASALVSTHSDRVLEMLDDPGDAVRVCGLDSNRVTVSRLDEAELPRWLEQFGDLGEIRAAGYLSRVVSRTPPAAPEKPS